MKYKAQKSLTEASTPLKGSALNSIHAEHNAMRKFTKLTNYTRSHSPGDNVDIIVLRISRTGILGNSKPCRNCIMRMSKFEYNIVNVYYSTGPDTIVRERFDVLAKQGNQMSRGDREKVVPKKITKKDRKRQRRLRKKMKYSTSYSSSDSDSDTCCDHTKHKRKRR